MGQRKTLTEKQIVLLRWIADGCSAGGVEGEHYRISAAALRSRGLVTTTGRGPTWTAKVTTAGQEYLAEVDSANPPAPRQPNVSVTVQLINDLIEAGGSLTFPQPVWFEPGSVDYERRARLVERHGKVPVGKLLMVRHRGREIQIDLIDAPIGLRPPELPIAVPAMVKQYHSVVKEFRDRIERHEVSRAALPRVLRILQGLVKEAERRGYTVRLAPDPTSNFDHRSSNRWSSQNDGHLLMGVRGFSTRLRVFEEGLPSRAYWAQQNVSRSKDSEKLSASTLRQYEAGATGRLVIELDGPYGHGGRVHRFADRRRWTLEEKLAEVLYGVELRAADDEERKREVERVAAEHKRAWEAAVERARECHAHQRRAEALDGQIARWQGADEIRSFCDAVEVAYSDDAETVEWVSWARAHASLIDPLSEAPRAPAPREPASLEELEPFLGGAKPPGRGGTSW
jgi:hypothetical protein